MDHLYISDLDGTLLDDRPGLSATSDRRLRHLLHAGLPFTVASARSVASIRHLLGDLPLSLPIIEFNGAFISDYKSGRHHQVNPIDAHLLPSVFSAICQRAGLPFVSSFDGRTDHLYYQTIHNDGMAHYLAERRRAQDPRLRPPTPLGPTLQEQVICLTAITKQDIAAELADHLDQTYPDLLSLHLFEDFYGPPGWFWLTVHDRRATKARAITQLLAELGLAANQLTVFGDHLNDLSMFELAGRAIAVANAHPAAKKKADRIIGSHLQDSVVRYIETDWSRRRSPAAH